MTAAPRPDFQMPHPCSASPTHNTHKRIAPKSGVRESSVGCVCRQRWRLQVQQWLLSEGDSALARAAAAQHTSAAANPPPPVRLVASMLLSSCPLQSSRAVALLRWLGWLTQSAAGRTEREAQSAAAITPLAARWVGEPEAGGTPRTCSKAQAVKSCFQLSLFDDRFHATTPCR